MPVDDRQDEDEDQDEDETGGILQRMFLADDPDVLIARAEIGMTFYLADPLAWARGAAAQALEAFLDFVPRDSLTWWSTSMAKGWREPARDEIKERLVPLLSNAELKEPRHGFRFRVSDDPEVPGVQFDYRESDPAREERASTLEITLPQKHPPAELLRLARTLTALGPLWSGTGGYVVRWNERQKTDGFWQAYRWSRRHLGLDVQDADAASWRVREGLASTNWLNYIGEPLCEVLDVPMSDLLAGAAARADLVRTFRDDHGTLFVAGDMQLGDVNAFQIPVAYTAASRLLSPLLDPTPEPMWAGFYAEGKTRAWQRRFLEPEAWQV